MVNNTTEHDSTAGLSARIAIAVNRLNMRLREEAGKQERGLTLSQIAMLQRLADKGPLSVSALAADEHVSQQAITQRLALLRPTGYISLSPDPSDRRSRMADITAAGRAMLEMHRTIGEQWLDEAITQTFDDDQIATLETAVGLLERLSKFDRKPSGPQK